MHPGNNESGWVGLPQNMRLQPFGKVFRLTIFFHFVQRKTSFACQSVQVALGCFCRAGCDSCKNQPNAMILYLILIGIPLLIGLYAQAKVGSAFKKYSQVPAASRVTGAEAARRILSAARINDVSVVEINDVLGDHYDPTHKRLCLSTPVYRTPSVAALGIAAHEAGHAIQDARAYAPLRWRMMAVPVTQIASQALPFVILGGFFFQMTGLILLGVIAYAVVTLFQLITLPVEFDASKRAKVLLSEMGMVQQGGEAVGVNRVLDAAALTYVAAFVAALGHLVHLLMIFLSSRD